MLETVIASVIILSSLSAFSSQKVILSEIPDKLSDQFYQIILENNRLSVKSFDDDKTIEDKLFGIGEKYNLSGRIPSSSKWVELRFDGSSVKITPLPLRR